MLRNPEFWVLVSTVIFFGVFGGRLWKAIAGMLDGHAVTIRTELAEAAKLRAEAEAMLRDAQAQRAAALEEARDVLAHSHAEAARLSEAAHAEAEASAQRRERMALERISAAEKAAVNDVRRTAADVAAEATRAVIARTLSAEDDAALVDGAIQALPQAMRAA